MPELVGMQHRIDETNYQQFAGPYVDFDGHRRYNATKYGKASRLISSLPETFRIIPKNESASRARDLEQSGADLISTFRKSGLKVKDQDGISYCHAECTTSGIEVIRHLQGESYHELSAAFIGNMVTNFQNAGAYIEDDLECAVKYGCAETKFVPSNNLSREWYNKNKDAVLANAALHKIDGWVNLGYARGSGSLNDKVRTALQQRMPVVVALDWWGHAILYLHYFENDDWGFLNSWGLGYGDKGIGRLSNGKGSPSAAWIPASCLANL